MAWAAYLGSGIGGDGSNEGPTIWRGDLSTLSLAVHSRDDSPTLPVGTTIRVHLPSAGLDVDFGSPPPAGQCSVLTAHVRIPLYLQEQRLGVGFHQERTGGFSGGIHPDRDAL
jgi:hypothetical protein